MALLNFWRDISSLEFIPQGSRRRNRQQHMIVPQEIWINLRLRRTRLWSSLSKNQNIFISLEYWSFIEMKHVIKAAVLGHNMIVKECISGYSSDWSDSRMNVICTTRVKNKIVLTDTSLEIDLFFLKKISVNAEDEIEVQELHKDLIRTLVEHRWVLFAEKIFFSQ